MSKDKTLVGAAGEHYIAFRLSAEGYAVGLTARGTRAVDLLVTNLDTGKSITVQVKTMKKAFVQSKKHGSFWKWRVGVARAQPRATFYYLFVDLKDNPSESPDVFVVPSPSLEGLLDEFPESGAAAKDAWCDIWYEDEGEYRNRWDVIKAALA